jgi:hypothetical protein
MLAMTPFVEQLRGAGLRQVEGVLEVPGREDVPRQLPAFFVVPTSETAAENRLAGARDQLGRAGRAGRAGHGRAGRLDAPGRLAPVRPRRRATGFRQRKDSHLGSPAYDQVPPAKGTLMARAADPKVTQAEPTAPRPVDGQGYQLDRWGLPLVGPARLRRLAELGKPDPDTDPAAWAPPAAPAQEG